jgi:hypothetical protein
MLRPLHASGPSSAVSPSTEMFGLCARLLHAGRATPAAAAARHRSCSCADEAADTDLPRKARLIAASTFATRAATIAAAVRESADGAGAAVTDDPVPMVPEVPLGTPGRDGRPAVTPPVGDGAATEGPGAGSEPVDGTGSDGDGSGSGSGAGRDGGGSSGAGGSVGTVGSGTVGTVVTGEGGVGKGSVGKGTVGNGTVGTGMVGGGGRGAVTAATGETEAMTQLAATTAAHEAVRATSESDRSGRGE